VKRVAGVNSKKTWIEHGLNADPDENYLEKTLF
jgi:hypothetical protein